MGATAAAEGGAVALGDGRLVYTTFETSGLLDREQRLWALNLRSSELIEGPLVPPVEELFVVDPGRGTLVLIALRAGIGVAYRVDELTADEEPVELARGDVLTLATDPTALLVGRISRSQAGCEGRGYEVARVEIGTGAEMRIGAGCGRLLGLATWGPAVLVSEQRGHQPIVRALGDEAPLMRGFALVSVSPRGDLLLADAEHGTIRSLGVWPETPTGPLFLWRGVGDPEPLVDDVRLFGERLVAWAPDGSAAVVNGIVGGDRAMFLVRGGTGTMLLAPNSFPLRSAFSGASFDEGGSTFAATVGHIVVDLPIGVEPLPLPAGAPTPLGPLVWLP